MTCHLEWVNTGESSECGKWMQHYEVMVMGNRNQLRQVSIRRVPQGWRSERGQVKV